MVISVVLFLTKKKILIKLYFSDRKFRLSPKIYNVIRCYQHSSKILPIIFKKI